MKENVFIGQGSWLQATEADFGWLSGKGVLWKGMM